jgi:hypothetical protein
VSFRGRAAAAPPPPLAGEFPGDPPPIIHGLVQSTIPVASLPARAPPRRQRACHRRQDQRGGTKGIFVKDLKVLGSFVHKDCSLFCGLVQQLVKSIKNRRKIQK